ncbi:MAG: hypothetical protein AUK44_06915 [Porphyromonadaceae bacterium CG2_30_38_12]|nr:MAG: hypothetical protein AUK44_06915 [Porphyromonadaceae bacterium CG2_30_38_12]
MNKAIIFCLTLISLNANAQLLWEISGSKIRHKSFLLATHQLVPAKAFDKIPGVFKAYNACKVVVCEFATSQTDTETELKKLALLPYEKSMKRYLNEATYLKIDSALKIYLKMNLQQIERLHPAVIRQLLHSELFKQANNIKDDAQTDSYFEQVANLKGKEIRSIFHTNKSLTELLDPQTIQLQTKLLSYETEKTDSIKSAYRVLLTNYQTNNLNALLAQNHTVGQLSSDWIELLQTKSCFITLDVQYFTGKQNIIDVLRNKGYQVIPYSERH